MMMHAMRALWRLFAGRVAIGRGFYRTGRIVMKVRRHRRLAQMRSAPQHGQDKQEGQHTTHAAPVTCHAAGA